MRKIGVPQGDIQLLILILRSPKEAFSNFYNTKEYRLKTNVFSIEIRGVQ